METPSTPHRQTHETSPAVAPSFPRFLLIQREYPFSCQRPASTCVLDLIPCWFRENFPSSLFCMPNSPSQQCSRKELSRSCSYPFNFEEASLSDGPLSAISVSTASPHIYCISTSFPTPTRHLHHFSNETLFVRRTTEFHADQSNGCNAILEADSLTGFMPLHSDSSL